MEFNQLSAREKAEVTYRELQKRKVEKEKGRKAADAHLHVNNLRIKKSLREMKHRRPAL